MEDRGEASEIERRIALERQRRVQAGSRHSPAFSMAQSGPDQQQHLLEIVSARLCRKPFLAAPSAAPYLVLRLGVICRQVHARFAIWAGLLAKLVQQYPAALHVEVAE